MTVPDADIDADIDESFMRWALQLSYRGAGRVSPNPLVGAVVVSGRRIIGEGWHTAFGAPHAEREALADCARRGEDDAVRGATVYVTLEPCCHEGNTPPCTDALIEAGVGRVVVGAPDPNPLVEGRGCSVLRDAGIEVVEDVLLDECSHANEAFFHYIQTGMPLMVAKYAMTLDGKVATRERLSTWITGVAARRRVHEDRRRFAGIMVGVGTVISDDPLLTCRIGDFDDDDDDDAVFDGDAHEDDADGEAENGEPQVASGPVRIICDSRLRTPPDAQVVVTANETRTLIATCVKDTTMYDSYLDRGCEIVTVEPDASNRVDLGMLVVELADRGVNGVIVEGGPTLLGAAFDVGIVDKVQAYVAPKVFGGTSAPSPVGGAGAAAPRDATMLSAPRITTLGDDILIEGDIVEREDI